MTDAQRRVNEGSPPKCMIFNHVFPVGVSQADIAAALAPLGIEPEDTLVRGCVITAAPGEPAAIDLAPSPPPLVTALRCKRCGCPLPGGKTVCATCGMPRPKNDPGFDWDGRLLQILRIYSGRSVREFAAEMGYSPVCIRYYERNAFAPTPAAVQDFGFMFGWDTDEFIENMRDLGELLESMRMDPW